MPRYRYDKDLGRIVEVRDQNFFKFAVAPRMPPTHIPPNVDVVRYADAYIASIPVEFLAR